MPSAEPGGAADGIWTLPDDEVFERLETSSRGLTEDEAYRRLQRYGHNVLPAKVSRPLIYKFLDQFTSLFAIMLEVGALCTFVAAMLSTGSGRQDNINVTIAIIGVVLLNGVIGFFQEYRAEKATEALQKLVPANAKVVRDGEVTIVAAADLVPGDVMVLEEGDSISADARVIRQYEMSTINIALTGESDAVRKTADPILEEELAVINMPNLVFMGTSVAAGTGRAVVFNTGLNTEFGRIFSLTAGVSEDKSPLMKQIDGMAKLVSTIAFICGVILFILALEIYKFGTVQALLFALGVMVALVPEGLPATLSVSLAVGVQRMAKVHALIKKLAGVETLGCTNVICTDKTGTLTKAEMTVKSMFVGGQEWEVTGAGYEPVGDFVLGGATLPKDEAKQLLEPMVRAMTFCNDSKVLPPSDDKGWRVIGDPTEGCLLVAAQKADFDLQTELIERPKIYELPFESVRKRMSVVHVEGDGQKAFVKGAPSETIGRCTKVRLNGQILPMTDEWRERITAQNDEMSRQALRVLAVAERELPVELTDYTPDSVETELTFVGLVGMIDPPRPEVSEAVEHALTAGIRIIMVTGDYGLTAEAIARRIGIVRGDHHVRVITGTDLEKMTEDDLKGELDKDQDVIFARVAPEHKMEVVKALKEMQQIVAVTGDGVNDAPALKKADIGVAMGLSGTDVSREAATMILLDDSFASIIKAVEQGRGVYANVKKMITYIFSHNMAELFPFVFAALAGVGLVPLGALQVLAIDLGSDVLPGLALGTEQPEPGVMKLPPRPRAERLMSNATLRRVVFIGAIESVFAMGGFLYVLLSHGWGWGDASWMNPSSPHYAVYKEALMMTQAAIVAGQIANGFACRTERESVFKVGLLKNRFLLVGQAVAILIICIIAYVPFAQDIFKTGPLTLADWGFLVVTAVVLFFAEEIRKWFLRRKTALQGG
ncbi:MAG TPA: cation-transporting P-type ATPase [Thermoleophilia bacterium]|nr:cation-transporting P-type ATPase [Thermoleophilia bacterium]